MFVAYHCEGGHIKEVTAKYSISNSKSNSYRIVKNYGEFGK